MKKIYGFLTAAAILLTAACTTDLDGPKVDEVKGDFYMTMNITPTNGVGTRASTTQTPNQGSEVGQDNENKIGSAIIVVAKKTGDNYTVHAVLESSEISNASNSVNATFKTERDNFLKEFGEDGTSNPGGIDYYMFVVANPTSEITAAYKAKVASNGEVQDIFTLDSDDNTYWNTTNGFLMSNAGITSAESDNVKYDAHVNIKYADVALGTHTTPATALPLGSVAVQRAMSRFDISTSQLEFTVSDSKSPISDIKVTFDAVALVNMAKTANIFKVTADSYTALGSKKIAFDKEKYTAKTGAAAESGNWVFSPDQFNAESKAYDFINQMFAGTKQTTGSSDAAFKLEGTAKNLDSFAYDQLSSLNGDRNTFTPPADAQGSDEANYGYKFWRYCMENTNPDAVANQKNGNTTGVIFRAKITGTGISAETKALYAYGNYVFGDATALVTYVLQNPEGHTEDADVYSTVSKKFIDALAAYNEAQGEDASKKFVIPDAEHKEDETIGESKNILKATQEQLAALNSYLVAQKFTIYKPADDQGNFYCYYFYWNRHNNNYDNTQMGIMEFATVRNNVYKLWVKSVLRLGHPANPDDDPDTPDPDDPDENDEFYCKIECKILDWEVRINGIEF